VHGADKWIVGLDLQPTSQGAVEFAAWLAASAEGTQLVGVHVLEEAYLRAVLKYHHLAEVEQGAREAAMRELDAADARDRFVDVELLQGGSAEKQLELAADRHHARGIIIGRQARVQGRHLLRLGRVARRLLRMVKRPTIVVPPDYDPHTGDGPVVATSNLRGDCAEAVRFASDIAQRLGRELVVVHVVPLPEDYAAHYLPESSLEKLRRENVTEGSQAVERWAEEHGFGSTECVLEQGGVVERVVHVVRERGASMLCTGSRHLSEFERVLLTSIGSELAASSPCPVAVVPPLASDE
jgi:nucleotide-binding universal stress UspA family protein